MEEWCWSRDVARRGLPAATMLNACAPELLASGTVVALNLKRVRGACDPAAAATSSTCGRKIHSAETSGGARGAMAKRIWRARGAEGLERPRLRRAGFRLSHEEIANKMV